MRGRKEETDRERELQELFDTFKRSFSLCYLVIREFLAVWRCPVRQEFVRSVSQ